MFKKKKKKDTVTLLEVTQRLRGLILDSQIQNAHELSVILGCPAISEEVAEMEEYASEERVEKIGYLVPMLYAHAHSMAEGSVEYQRSQANEALKKGLPEEIWHESRTMMTNASMAALMGSISQLVDMGLLEIPKKYK